MSLILYFSVCVVCFTVCLILGIFGRLFIRLLMKAKSKKKKCFSSGFFKKREQWALFNFIITNSWYSFFTNYNPLPGMTWSPVAVIEDIKRIRVIGVKVMTFVQSNFSNTK